MAKNANYYAKIAGTWEQQYLKTTSAQTTYTDPGTGFFNGQTTVKGALDKIQASVGAANGLATLDSLGKVPITQIPASITGGMNFEGTIDLSAVGGKNGDDLGSAGLETIGDYLIVSATGFINNDGSPLITLAVQAPGDEGDSTITNGIELEAGDWIVLVDKVGQTYTIAIINNTYQNASASARGIVQLSDYADGGGLQSLDGGGVITEQNLALVLGDNFAGSGGDFGTAETFSRSDHTHAAYLAKSGGTMTGDLTIGDGNNNADELIMQALDVDASLGSNSNAITFRYLPAGGTLSSENLYANLNGFLIYAGNYVLDSNNWNSFANEIHLSTSAPTAVDGKNGDIWIQYSDI